MDLSECTTAPLLQFKKGPSAQLHVHTGHSHSLQHMLHRAEDAHATSTNTEAEQAGAVSSMAKAGEQPPKCTAVRFASDADSPTTVEDPEPCSKSLPKPVWTTINLPLPLDTQHMAEVRRSALRRASNWTVGAAPAESAQFVSPPGPQGASWIPQGRVTKPEHPYTSMQQQGWMQVGGSCAQTDKHPGYKF